MNLKSIKLAGFKSFVDPTVILIQSNLTGIVGPNGCGKSNVVDAIRWVIGENSAKQLRGQAMSDVIFNGTTHRKPVSMASVELIFDNTSGRISGEYAKFSEISIRREVQREGQSQYFLNGVSCRRRDIIDLFLGTGSRSYAIIEQGIISKIIEAKPDELYHHFEEVSGVSKYKERKRETETRMHHTQENLDRLNDLNEELAKQLRHLKRQAESAERYSEFKQEERKLQAEIKALQWQALERQREAQDSQLTQNQLVQEEHLTELRRLETDIEKIRALQTEVGVRRDELQKKYYGLGAEIARLEQRIQSRQDQIRQWRKELTDVEAQYQELQDHHEEQSQHVIDLTQEHTTLQPQEVIARSEAKTAHDHLQMAENQMREWQQRWDQFQSQISQLAQKAGILKTNTQHYEQQSATLTARHSQLQERNMQLPLGALNAEIEPLIAETEERRAALEALQIALNSARDSIQLQRQNNNEMQQTLQQHQKEMQTLQSRYASLEALQQAALGYQDDVSKTWLTKQGIHDRPRLAQVLQVNPGWELAVETVLGGYFDAVCLENADAFLEAMNDAQGNLTIMDRQASEPSAQNEPSLDLLFSQVQSAWPLQKWLSGIYIAENLIDALEKRNRLANDESIVTRDGFWLGKNWARISKGNKKESGVLAREQTLKRLAQDIQQMRAALEEQQNHLEQGEKQLRLLEEQRDSQHQKYQHISASLTELQTRLSARQSRLSEIHQQQQRLIREIQECEQAIQQTQELLEKNRDQHSQILQTEQAHTEQKTKLLEERDAHRNILDDIRRSTHEKQRTADELAVRLVTVENQLTLLKQNSLREERQRQQCHDRIELLTAHLEENEEPLNALRAELQEYLNSRLTLEQELRSVEEQWANGNQQLETSTQAQQNAHEKWETAKNHYQTLQMERQAVSVRQMTIQEQFAEQNIILAEIIAALPQDVDALEWEKKLERVIERIQRLGPINLAAIDEYQVVNERKTYLEKQQVDLTEALEILKSAIQKIDRETRTQFQDTFEQVNKHFQELFPQIFGGGKAILELVEEDSVTSGVLVKAQPPGKRNATIHMLSGGEKALTAIALVFSMFRLNPAPFCVLDEVDAPLDDFNVNRFCQLVKEMAKTTQFIVISHNKVTISMLEILMGVTMQEAGVSRIVSVNVADAVALAEA